jgi:DNA-binding transcriptional regulator GbsR (MarR family)
MRQMGEDLRAARDRFIQGIVRMSDLFGLNRFTVQLYAFLYLTGRPVSLDEIVEELGVSKGNVSVNIRELEKWGAVKKTWVKGSRKDYYEAEPDIKKVFSNKLKSAIQKRISEVSSLTADFDKNIKTTNGNLAEEDKALVKSYRERLKKIEELKNLASAALAVADKLL